MSPLVPLLLAAWPALADSPIPPLIAAAGAGAVCRPDWETGRRGHCWIRGDILGEESWVFVHRRGWLVDRRCLEDGRFTAKEFLAALDDAYKKLSPEVSVRDGGCLADFNPAWARRLHDAPWRRRMVLSCGVYEADARACATHQRMDAFRTLAEGRVERLSGYYRLIRIKNAGGCMGPEGTGLSGIVFHETLHGDDADNFSTEEHNEGWKLPQVRFVYDHVYGAESVCYYGTDPSRIRYSNFLQCLFLTRQAGQEEKRELCRLFPSSYTDTPAGFIKH